MGIVLSRGLEVDGLVKGGDRIGGQRSVKAIVKIEMGGAEVRLGIRESLKSLRSTKGDIAPEGNPAEEDERIWRKKVLGHEVSGFEKHTKKTRLRGGRIRDVCWTNSIFPR